MRELEAGFQQAVIDLAHSQGWVVAHFGVARTKEGGYLTPAHADARGWPDLVLVRDRVLFRELKSDTGVLKPAQRDWRDRLLAAGADWECWKPYMWNVIVKELLRKKAA